MTNSVIGIFFMGFPKRLVELRKNNSLTQQELADKIKINVSQLKRYEGGTSQPTLDVIKRLSIVLSVKSDDLIFDADERKPDDEDLLHQFETVSNMDQEDKNIVIALLEGMIIKYKTKKMVYGIKK